MSFRVMGFAGSGPEEMFANDKRIAAELEAAIAALREDDPAAAPPMPATRAEERATAIVTGEQE